MVDVRRILILLLASAWTSIVSAEPSQSKAHPLSEAALIKLAKSDIEDEVIVALVKKRGLSFTVDDPAVKRLKKAGVSSAVLAAVQPAEEDSKPADDGNKPLATGKHEEGLIVEVLEVKPTKNEELMIRWRYRNPTGKNIQLIAATPRFRGADSPPNTAEKFFQSAFYKEGKFETDAAFNHYVIAQGNGRLNVADLGKAAVVIRADEVFETWAIFTLPQKKSEKTITLFLMNTSPIKNIRIQEPE
jgi:hypothetical protein